LAATGFLLLTVRSVSTDKGFFLLAEFFLQHPSYPSGTGLNAAGQNTKEAKFMGLSI